MRRLYGVYSPLFGDFQCKCLFRSCICNRCGWGMANLTQHKNTSHPIPSPSPHAHPNTPIPSSHHIAKSSLFEPCFEAVLFHLPYSRFYGRAEAHAIEVRMQRSELAFVPVEPLPSEAVHQELVLILVTTYMDGDYSQCNDCKCDVCGCITCVYLSESFYWQIYIYICILDR